MLVAGFACIIIRAKFALVLYVVIVPCWTAMHAPSIQKDWNCDATNRYPAHHSHSAELTEILGKDRIMHDIRIRHRHVNYVTTRRERGIVTNLS